MTLHEQKSEETKKKLSASLKKLMQQKDFNKISINDLVGDAGLNRNSFYYHFRNIFDLLKYTFENDTIRIIEQIDLDHDLRKAIYFIIDYIDQNKAFCTCAYKSLGKTELRKFLDNNLENIITEIIDNIIARRGLRISENFRRYIIYSQTGLMAIHIIGYLENKSELSKEQLADYTLLLFHSSIGLSLEIADAKGL